MCHPHFCARCDHYVTPGRACPRCQSTDWSRSPRADVDRLVSENLGLVHWTLRQRVYPRLDATIIQAVEHEAESAGMLALLKAARYFDPSFNVKFSTYAVISIERACWRHVSQELRERSRHWQFEEDADIEARHDGQDDAIDARNVASRLLATLDDRSRYIVERCVMRGEKLHVVGAALGLTRERVRQIRERAIEVMGEACI